jgi:hypothetical protein
MVVGEQVVGEDGSPAGGKRTCLNGARGRQAYDRTRLVGCASERSIHGRGGLVLACTCVETEGLRCAFCIVRAPPCRLSVPCFSLFDAEMDRWIDR